ncbi:hypothetical protein RhiirA4_470579 [Rhizophagus irregularis]|uniref:DUF8211 domain-containing protein n=1 Tax=Rhizophagus irregularis TaxID=588596 RepID=A0A2I1H1K8_9GLOM|nr:hypothetical protein RhiirA4_470579 [Rhizophagus irregularis]
MDFFIEKPLPVAFHKFHVTRPNRAGCNKIYEIRRSKSFFFELANRVTNTNDIHLKIYTNDYHMKKTPISYNSTCRFPNLKYQISKMLQHFFSHQKVIPRSIQKKYFNLIRSKLLDRHFHIKSHAEQLSVQNRRTKTFFNFTYKRYRFHFGIYIPCCVTHQRSINIFHNIKNDSQTHNNTFNNKQNHAIRLFNEWKNRNKKHIYSNRLGISYEVSYQANAKEYLDKYNNKSIYRKCLENFRIRHRSRNKSQTKKQKRRFERACKSVFNNRGNRKAKSQPAITLEDRLHRARQHRFLFLPSQYIYKPIQHLKYRFITQRSIPTSPVPDDGLTHDTDIPIPSKEGHTWHDTLGILIPNDLLPYVDDQPIYINNTQARKKGTSYSPGSKKWFQIIRKRKDDHEEQNKAAIDAQQYKDRARLWNTSEKWLYLREEETTALTDFQNHYHKQINKLTDDCKELHDQLNQEVIRNKSKKTKRLTQLEQELAQFKLDYLSTQSITAHHLNYKGDISDDTKELERRPNKRYSLHHTDSHLNHNGSKDKIKKVKIQDLIVEEWTPSTSY